MYISLWDQIVWKRNVSIIASLTLAEIHNIIVLCISDKLILQILIGLLSNAYILGLVSIFIYFVQKN